MIDSHFLTGSIGKSNSDLNKSIHSRIIMVVSVLFLSALLTASSSILAADPAATPLKLLLVSSAVKDADVIADAAASGVGIVYYDPGTTLDDLLQRIKTAAGDDQISKLGLVSYDLGWNEVDLTAEHSLRYINSNQQEMVGFYGDLAMLMDPNGRIDIFASNAATGPDGPAIIAIIESQTGFSLAASTDETGNPSAGGNWILEIGSINLETEYFTAGALDSYDGILTQSAQRLSAADSTNFKNFGNTVSISGDTTIVGAYVDTISENTWSGSAYIYDRNQGGADKWGQVIKLIPSNVGPSHQFGTSVGISGDIAIVGAPNVGHSGFYDAGAAYIFSRDQGGADNWGEVKEIVASDPSDVARFGSSLAISGDYAVVGAYSESHSGSNAVGSVYIYYRNQGGADNWGQVKRITLTDAAAFDLFGIVVAISGDTVVAGAPGKDRDDNEARSVGYAYVYQRDQGGADNWGEVKKLNPNGGTILANFGYKVAVSGDTIIVTSEFDTYEDLTGCAYVFSRDLGGADNWGKQKKLKAPFSSMAKGFYKSVALSGDYAIVQTANRNSGDAAILFHRNQGGTDNWGVSKVFAGLPGSNFNSIYRFSQLSITSDYAVISSPQYDFKNYEEGGTVYLYRLTDPQLSNPGADDISATAADLGCRIDNDGNAGISRRGVVWSTSPNPDLGSNDGYAQVDGSSAIFAVKATGLAKNTTYHYRAFATNSMGTSYTSDATFTTLLGDIPDLSNPTSTDIGATTAVLGATVDDAGDSPVIERGILLSTDSNLDALNYQQQIPVSGSTGTYSVEVTSLLPETTYFYCGYARNSYGTSVSDVASFTTAVLLSPPVAVSVSPTGGSGTEETFTAVFRDPDGTANLKYAYFKVAETNMPGNCVYLRYDISVAQLRIRNDAGSSWSDPVNIGANGTLSNSQGSINCANVVADRGNIKLVLTIPISFTESFTGLKNIYIYAYDYNSFNSGWQRKGIYTVEEHNYAPEVISITPNSGSGAWKTFKAVYRELDGVDDLFYAYFKMNADAGIANAVYLRSPTWIGADDIQLRNDTGTGWIYCNVYTGTSRWIYNGQVSVNVAYVSVTRTATDFTLQIPMRFKAAFAGDKKTYLYANDGLYANSGWQQKGIFTVTAPSPTEFSQSVSLSSIEAELGRELDFADLAPGVEDAIWFVNGDRLPADDARFRFSRKGLYSVSLFGKNVDGEEIVSGADLFVGEELLKGSDLIAWDGAALPVKRGEEDVEATSLVELSGDEERIVRLRGLLKPGMRLIFDGKSANDYRFIELRNSDKTDKALWVVGRVQAGRERILSSRSMPKSAAEQILTIKLDAKRGTLRLLLNRKAVFNRSQRLRGDHILLVPANSGDQLDIIISKLK